MSSIMRARNGLTGRSEVSEVIGALSRAEGCWTFDAPDRMPRPSRATAHHLAENAPTATRVPSRASGFVRRRVSPVPVRPGEGPPTEPTPTVQTWRPQLVFMFLEGPSRPAREIGPVAWIADLDIVQDQAAGPLATTVKLGRASAALVLCTTLNAAIGLRRPFSSRFPRSSSLTAASTAPAMRLLTRIWPS